MTKTALFHKSGLNNKYNTKNYSTSSNNSNTTSSPKSVGSTLKESFAIGVGVSAANELVSRTFTSILGPRSVEVVNKTDNTNSSSSMINKCDSISQDYMKCLKLNNKDQCNSLLDEFDKCLKN